MVRPVAGTATVRVEGLDELRREIRKLDDGKSLTDELKAANKRVGDIVVRRAQQRASALGRMQGAAGATLRSASQAARAVVTLGRAGVPFAMGAEFGAGRDQERVTRRGSVLGWNQFRPWRGSGPGAGYFLWPAVRDSNEDIEQIYGDEIERISSKAFPS